MMKKALALVLVTVLALGALAMTATADNEDAVDYRVGYAKTDLNPYWSVWEEAGNEIPAQAVTSTGEKVTSDHIMPLPMGGYGGNTHRLSRPELVDDNGSGVHADSYVYLSNNRYTQAFAKEMLGEGTAEYNAYAAKGFGQNDGDGIYVTCVSVRQNADAEPVLIFSVDLISIAETYAGQAKGVIMRELKKIGVDITPDRILINATHTHGAVALGESFSSSTTYKQKLYGNTDTVSFAGSELSSYLNFFRKHLYNQLAAAAVKALTDGESNGTVTMRKGTIDVFEATGYTLNGVRHRKAQLTTTVDGVSQKVDYVTGSSFNVDLSGETEISSVSESDEKLHVVEFSFPDAKPILMINWRAHTTANNKMNTKAHNNLSADFVAAMRYQLEAWGYRPVLNYGASGNLGMGDTPNTFNISTSATATTMNATKYGYTLAFAAAYLAGSDHTEVTQWRTDRIAELKSKRGYNILGDTYKTWNPVYQAVKSCVPSMTTCAQGPIVLESTWYDVKAQTSTDAQYEAALYHSALAVDEGGSASNDGGLKLEKTGYPFVVKAGTYTANGQTFTVSGDVVIASQYHANSLKNRHGVLNAKRISLTAFVLGDQVAFVTMPFEASDRYSMEATLSTASDYNDWDNLINDSKWGTPIVMTLTNGANGYFPNNLAYTYDRDLEAKTIAGTIGQNFVSGSYEAHTAYAAAGEGENVVKALNTLLRDLSGTQAKPVLKTGYCEACKTVATWTPLDSKLAADLCNTLVTGHYYLAEDQETNGGELLVYLDEQACLDLNGHTYYSNTNTGTSRVSTIYGTLNLQDSVGGGVIKGKAAGGSQGGTFQVHSQGALNLYSGTVTCDTTGSGTVLDGGCIYVRATATLNMYGGTVRDGKATQYGGNVDVQDGTFNMYGGTITGGSAKNGNNFLLSNSATFRYVNGTIASGATTTHLMGHILLGDHNYVVTTPAKSVLAVKNYATVTLDGVFTGDVVLNYTSSKAYPTKPAVNDVIGTVTEGSSIDHAKGNIAVTGVSAGYEAIVSGTDLIVGEEPEIPVATVNGTNYTEIGAAMAACSQAHPAVLLSDVETIALEKNGWLDLNGHDVAAVTGSYKLTVMDSATADYDVADGVYGTVPAAANVQAAEGYIPVTVAGKTSLHKYGIKLTELVVNTEKVGLTYKAEFKGDDMVKNGIREFGVAVRAYYTPDKNSILLDTAGLTHMALSSQQWENGATAKSVYVVDIMDESVTAATNTARAKVPVYGIGYIKLNDDTYIFGDSSGESLQSALQYMNDLWNSQYLNDANRAKLASFCSAWESVMKDWDGIERIKNAAGVTPTEIPVS